jgi:catechol 2,3-dioxygenase
MAVDPLDRDGLLADAGKSRWTGAPALTRMGHLHLFVGDLTAAERHYVRGLGFDVVTRRLRGALFVSTGGYHHHLGLNTWAASSPAAGEGEAGLDEWTLELPPGPSLDTLVSRLASAGIAAAARPDGVSVVDPWGIPLHVAVPPARTGAA